MKRLLTLLLVWSLVIPAALMAANGSQSYLLMQEILNALGEGDFNSFKNQGFCEEKISINFEPPFDLHGYLDIDKFIHDFTLKFSQFETENIEWVSKQLEEQFAVQSLNIILKNKRSEKIIYYKFIFFLTKKIDSFDFMFFSIKKDEKWKIYYIRGLKI
jgi:hypothetical protein